MKISNKKKKYFQTESIVLNLFNLGEADRIITLLTPNYGIIRAVANGVRKPNSRIGGHLDILNKINAYVRIGENLNNLSQADTIDGYSGIKQNLKKISLCFYILELSEKFSVENDPNNNIYQLLEEVLESIKSVENDELLIRWFEIKLLISAGFLPELYNCLISGKKLKEGDHVFSFNEGGLIDYHYYSESLNHSIILKKTIKATRFLVDNNWSNVNKLNISQKTINDIKIIMQRYIRTLINSRVNSETFLSLIHNN